jgi:hypothetical protein
MVSIGVENDATRPQRRWKFKIPTEVLCHARRVFPFDERDQIWLVSWLSLSRAAEDSRRSSFPSVEVEAPVATFAENISHF